MTKFSQMKSRDAASSALSSVPLSLLVTLANAAKPVTVDDAWYLTHAQHIAHDPFNPYGFYRILVLAARAGDGSTVTAQLSLLARGWYALFGESLPVLKLWLFPFVWLLAWSLNSLLKRFARGAEKFALSALDGFACRAAGGQLHARCARGGARVSSSRSIYSRIESAKLVTRLARRHTRGVRDADEVHRVCRSGGVRVVRSSHTDALRLRLSPSACALRFSRRGNWPCRKIPPIALLFSRQPIRGSTAGRREPPRALIDDKSNLVLPLVNYLRLSRRRRGVARVCRSARSASG